MLHTDFISGPSKCCTLTPALFTYQSVVKRLKVLSSGFSHFTHSDELSGCSSQHYQVVFLLINALLVNVDVLGRPI